MSRPIVERVPGTPPELSGPTLTKVARLYAKVFEGFPWFEKLRCSKEGIFLPTGEVGDPCPGCGDPLAEAYPLVPTKRRILWELGRPAAAAWLLYTPEGKEAGFGWAFMYGSPTEFAADKFETPEMQETVVGTLAEQDITGPLYYLSEMGFDPVLRGMGLSRVCIASMLDCATELGLPAVGRTLPAGYMGSTLGKLMTQVIGPEAAKDEATGERYLTGRMLGPPDTEMTDRGLYIWLPGGLQTTDASNR